MELVLIYSGLTIATRIFNTWECLLIGERKNLPFSYLCERIERPGKDQLNKPITVRV